MNGATRDRFDAIELAARLGDTRRAIEIAELIEYEPARIDAYRVMARSYASCTSDVEALEWAKAQKDDDVRFAALIGLLEHKADQIDYDIKTSLQVELDRLNRIGKPWFLGGC